MYRKLIDGNKEQRAEAAKGWLSTLKKDWSNDVNNAVEHTTKYRHINPYCFDLPIKKQDNTITRIYNNDVVTCAKAAVTHATKGSKVMVLNFASFVNPGGGFLKGSIAQEEALCHATGLYPCLSAQKEWYDENRKMKTGYVYRNDYIYSENVPFIVNGKCYLVDVLTMAAPNKNKSSNAPVEEIFEERMECAMLVGIERGVDIALLGAWGCGVFGNDPEFVAKTWKKLTVEYNGFYKEIVHPVLDKNQCTIFKDVYKNSYVVN